MDENNDCILMIKTVQISPFRTLMVALKDILLETNFTFQKDGIRVVIDLRRGVEPETVRRQLYKLTSVESSFGFNTLAIVDGKPKILSLKDFISEFVSFREKTVTRKIRFELAKTEERAHVLIGIATAVENIDPIIKIIKSSKDTETAKKNLLNMRHAARNRS